MSGSNFQSLIASVPTGGLVTVLSVSPTLQTTGWNGFTIKQRVERSALTGVPGSSTKIRVTLHGGSTEGAAVSALYVGLQSGTDPYDTAALTQITVGGSNSFTVPVGSTSVSDIINFTDNGSSALIFSGHFNSTSNDNIMENDVDVTGLANRYFKNASEAATTNATGYTSTTNRLAFILQIEMGT